MADGGTGPEYRTILVERRGRVGLVTLNRPRSMNALTPTMGRELGHALTTLDAADDVAAIVVTGAGEAFCGGAALEGSTFVTEPARDDIGPPASAISPWTLATPILAAINGAAVGVGITYPLQWDIRIAAEDARIGFIFTRVGVPPEANSTWLLARAIGSSRAIELLLTGRTLSGAEAAEIGLVSRAVPKPDVLAVTLDLAGQIAERTSPAAVGITKKMFYEFLETGDRQAARQVEREAFAWLMTQEDAREGITSFFEKRRPVYRMSKHTAVPGADPFE
jgi:enoyl-CoA hydratase/carnithine racemase